MKRGAAMISWFRTGRWHWVALMGTVLFVAIVRLRLLDIPLERDEGEYAYAGQLMLSGIPPYSLVYNMKLPGTYVMYALIEAVFGQTTAGIHLGFLFVNAAAIVLVFLLGRRPFGAGAGAMAGASYALLSLSPSVLGTSAHATHFVVVPVLAGFLLLIKSREGPRCLKTAFPAALLFGLSFIMKQQAVYFLVFAWALFAWSLWKERSSGGARMAIRLAIFTLGLAIPFLVTCILLWRAGVWETFWFWTFHYAREYVSVVSPAEGSAYFQKAFPKVVGSSLLIWALAGTGLFFLYCEKRLSAFTKIAVTLFTIFSALTVTPGLYFRLHYFVTILPAVALLAGNGCAAVSRYSAGSGLKRWRTIVPAALGICALGWVIIGQWSFFFIQTPTQASRTLYGSEPFPETVEISRYLKAHSNPGDRIAVLGAEPQIFFYTGRRSATGYIYFYGVWEVPAVAERMAKEMVREIEAAQPRYVIVEFIPPRLIDWARGYLNTNYSIVGRVDIVSDDRTDYHWGEKARSPGTAPARTLVVLERKGTHPL
jgi:4-amino-4-deoxy-L-arabinose transferase-like glycosyltransferase